jgi:DNA replication and repair protein RecF
MLNKITLHNFRNFSEARLEFAAGVNLLSGPNGAGKTNLLEAIGLFALGKSCRNADDRAMVCQARELAEISAAISGQKKKSR